MTKPEKKALLTQLREKLKQNRTLFVVSLEGISASQVQQVRAALMQKAELKIVRRHLGELLFKEKLNELKNYLNKPFGLVFSQLEPFELAAELAELRFPIKLKAGQVIQKDLWLEAGQTELPAGPAVAELSALGVKIGIDSGKVVIREPALLAKAGQPISQEAASIAAKLELAPFSQGLEPLAAYDSKENKIYISLKIDKEATIAELKKAVAQTINFALKMNYITKETLASLLSKAFQEACAVSNLVK